MIAKDISEGIIQPLKSDVFKANQANEAAKLLSDCSFEAKVLLKIRENEADAGSLPIAVSPRFYCNPQLSYIIVGGLGGFGLELANWLVLRGCRKLVLSSSRGITKQYQAFRIKFVCSKRKILANSNFCYF